jgi:putative ABC transport system ATP-binding protein
VVLESLRSINATGQTIVMATHEVRSACIGDRIVFLRDGQIQAEYRISKTTPIAEREAAVLAWLVGLGW